MNQHQLGGWLTLLVIEGECRQSKQNDQINGADSICYRCVLESLSRSGFSSLSFCSLSAMFYQINFLLKNAHLFSHTHTHKKNLKLFSAALKGLHCLAPIFTQAFILPIFSHNPHDLPLYQTSQ